MVAAQCSDQLEDHVGRDTEAIERDIENARNQLASTLDELSVRASPKNVMAHTKQTVMEKAPQAEIDGLAPRSLPPTCTPRQAAAWTMLARALLNLDEFITRE